MTSRPRTAPRIPNRHHSSASAVNTIAEATRTGILDEGNFTATRSIRKEYSTPTTSAAGIDKAAMKSSIACSMISGEVSDSRAHCYFGTHNALGERRGPLRFSQLIWLCSVFANALSQSYARHACHRSQCFVNCTSIRKDFCNIWVEKYDVGTFRVPCRCHTTDRF